MLLWMAARDDRRRVVGIERVDVGEDADLDRAAALRLLRAARARSRTSGRRAGQPGRRPAERLKGGAAVHLVRSQLVDDLESVAALRSCSSSSGVEVTGHGPCPAPLPERRLDLTCSGRSGTDSDSRTDSPRQVDRARQLARRAGARAGRTSRCCRRRWSGMAASERLRVGMQRAARTALPRGPTSTSCPRYITATRWLTKRITPRSCDTKRYASSSRSRRSTNRLRICARTDTSSADTASSATISRGSHGERAGDADALALAAAQLVRIALGVLGLEGRPSPAARDAVGALRVGGEAVHAHRLADDARDRHARVQRRVRVLEDDLRLAPERQQRAGRQGGDVLPVEDDAPARWARWRAA